MAQTAVIIGPPDLCRRLERQLDLLPQRPRSLGWILAPPEGDRSGTVLGGADDLESIVTAVRPDLALVTLPAAMSGLIEALRTRLRRLGVPDRFMPALEDQLAGIGPRSRLEIDPERLLGRRPRPVDEQAAARVIRGRRVLITGAGGSIGSELARLAAGLGAGRLLLVERSENALFEIDRRVARQSPAVPRLALLHDVVDARATARLFRRLRPEIVFHAAAHKHVPMMEDHPAAAVDNNLFGTRSVADAAGSAGAERFVLISTDKAVNPRSVMGATKRLAEMYVQHAAGRWGTRFAIVRFGNVLGSTGSVLDVWSRELADGGPLTVTDPRMTRYFMTVSEAAALVVQSAALPQGEADAASVFLLDMGRPICVLELARRFVELHGLSPVLGGSASTPRGAVRIVFTGARPGEKLHEELGGDPASVGPTRHPEILRQQPAAPLPGIVDAMLAELAPRRRSRRPAEVAAAVRACIAGAVRPVAA